VHPLRRQTNESVSKLLDELEELDLTKSERLQLVNLAPTSIVELHVVRPLSSLSSLFFLTLPLPQCIEDIGERFDDPAQESLVALITSHLSSVEDTSTAASKDAADAAAAREAAQRDKDKMEIDEREAEAVQDDSNFVNEGWDGQRANENAENDIDE
jgi:hypothetical protein